MTHNLFNRDLFATLLGLGGIFRCNVQITASNISLRTCQTLKMYNKTAYDSTQSTQLVIIDVHPVNNEASQHCTYS